MDYYEEEKKKYVSLCGAYCRVCDPFAGKKQHIAQKALNIIEKRESEFEKLLEDESIKKNIVQILTKQASWLCRGCKVLVDNPRAGYECKIRQCCLDKNLDLCSQCEEFSCATLINHPTAIKLHSVENLREIRDKGIERWLDRCQEEFTKSQKKGLRGREL